jgi:hypothetical protein
VRITGDNQSLGVRKLDAGYDTLCWSSELAKELDKTVQSKNMNMTRLFSRDEVALYY